MRLKFTPATTAVKAILQECLNSEQKLLAEDDAKYAELTATNEAAKIHNPYKVEEASQLLRHREGRVSYIEDRKRELALLETHTADRLMVEFDL